MDILLSKFVSEIINSLSFNELKKLDKFMDCNDEDIQNFYLNKTRIPYFDDQKILNLFSNYKV